MDTVVIIDSVPKQKLNSTIISQNLCRMSVCLEDLDSISYRLILCIQKTQSVYLKDLVSISKTLSAYSKDFVSIYIIFSVFLYFTPKSPGTAISIIMVSQFLLSTTTTSDFLASIILSVRIWNPTISWPHYSLTPARHDVHTSSYIWWIHTSHTIPSVWLKSPGHDYYYYYY